MDPFAAASYPTARFRFTVGKVGAVFWSLRYPQSKLRILNEGPGLAYLTFIFNNQKSGNQHAIEPGIRVTLQEKLHSITLLAAGADTVLEIGSESGELPEDFYQCEILRPEVTKQELPKVHAEKIETDPLGVILSSRRTRALVIDPATKIIPGRSHFPKEMEKLEKIRKHAGAGRIHVRPEVAGELDSLLTRGISTPQEAEWVRKIWSQYDMGEPTWQTRK